MINCGARGVRALAPRVVCAQVRGTVRSLTNAKAIDYLKALPGAAERLELVEADLMKPNSFDAAVAGCSAVYVLESTHACLPCATRARVAPALRMVCLAR